MRIHAIPPLLALAAPSSALAQVVDVGFDEVTSPADVDLVVVRERAYGAGGVDLTASDAVLADVAPAPLGSVYCMPAAPNTTGRPASTIALGSLAVADNDFHLRVLDLPTQTVGYFLSSRSAGFVAMPGGSQGNLCVGAPVGRHNMQAGSTLTSTTSFTLQVDLTAIPTAVGLTAVAPGETWYFQCWYRQAPNTSNFTDAIQVSFQ